MQLRGYITFLKCFISAGIFGLLLSASLAFAGADEFVGPPVESPQPSSDFVGPPVESPQPFSEKPVNKETEPDLFASVDAERDYLSTQLIDFTTQVDHFFGDPRYFQEHNNSLIQLALNSTTAESGNQVTTFDGQAKLDLPAAQRRFQLVLESNPEKRTTTDGKGEQPASVKDVTTPDHYSAALRFERKAEDVWHFSSDAGATVQFPLDPFVRLRGSYAVPVSDWRLKLSELVFWFGTIGLGETTQFDLEHILSPPVLFRATSTATCYEAPQHCDLRQDFSVFHTLDDRSAVVYQASVVGTDTPSLMDTNYILSMRYRYRLHKKWVFLDVAPQLFFPRTDNFHLNALLLLRLEVLIGADSR